MGQFETDTAVTKIADNRWTATCQRGWRIGSTMNGGYILSLIARALREALPHRDPLSVNAFYFSPCVLGECEIAVEILKENRGTSFGSASLFQDGELKVRATAAYTDIDRLQGETWINNTPPAVPAFEDCAHSSAHSLEIHERVDMRLIEGQGVFTGEPPSKSGEFVAWLQHRDGAPSDTIDLAMWADIMPPPPFTLFGPFGWVPTIELTVQCRKKPAPGPVIGRLTSRHLTNGIIESDSDLWDSGGQLIGLARQTMKVKLPSNP